MVAVMVTEKRWTKTRTIIRRVVDEMTALKECREREGSGPWSIRGIDHNALESDHGFLIYVSQTYPSMSPYLKGIHLTLDSWREERRDDGWKRSRNEMELLHRNSDIPERGAMREEGAPPFVEYVPRYEADVLALQALTDPQLTPKRHM
jgi:hypothetical protein